MALVYVCFRLDGPATRHVGNTSKTQVAIKTYKIMYLPVKQTPQVSLQFAVNHKSDAISVLICINVLKQVGWKNNINPWHHLCVEIILT